MKYGSGLKPGINLDFSGMRIYGSDRLSLLTMKYPEQADQLIRIYDATEGAEVVDRLLRFIGTYGSVDPGMLNFSGHILTTALKKRQLTPEEEARIIDQINRTASTYKGEERFGYFSVPLGAKNPKVRIIVRDQDYGNVTIALDMKDRDSYRRLVEEPANRVLGDINRLYGEHGSEIWIIEGDVTDPL